MVGNGQRVGRRRERRLSRQRTAAHACTMRIRHQLAVGQWVEWVMGL